MVSVNNVSAKDERNSVTLVLGGKEATNLIFPGNLVLLYASIRTGFLTRSHVSLLCFYSLWLPLFFIYLSKYNSASFFFLNTKKYKCNCSPSSWSNIDPNWTYYLIPQCFTGASAEETIKYLGTQLKNCETEIFLFPSSHQDTWSLWKYLAFATELTQMPNTLSLYLLTHRKSL